MEALKDGVSSPGHMANGWRGRIWIQDLRLEPRPIGGLGMHILRSCWGWWDERMLVQDFNACPDTHQVYILSRNLPPELSVIYSVKWEEHLSSARAKPFPALLFVRLRFWFSLMPNELWVTLSPDDTENAKGQSMLQLLKILFLVKQSLHIFFFKPQRSFNDKNGGPLPDFFPPGSNHC